MVLKVIFTLIIIIFSFTSFLAKGNNLALPCLGCHASTVESIPNINGLSVDYFINAFTDYKKDIRDHYLMRIIAKGYTDNQIKLLAKYFEKYDEN